MKRTSSKSSACLVSLFSVVLFATLGFDALAEEKAKPVVIDPEIERLVIATEACSVFHPKRCEALASIVERGESSVTPLFDLLRRSEGKRRAACVRALAYVGNKEVGKELLVLHSDRSEEVRIASIDAVSRLLPEGAVEALAKAAGGENVNIKSTAVVGLGRTRSPGAVVPLLRALTHFHPKVKAAAARALGMVGDQRATTPLAEMLADPIHRTPVRIAICEALGALGDLSGTPMLLLTLGDGETRVRIAAVTALGRLKDPRAIPALSLLLRESELALPVARALMAMGHMEAQPALLRAIRTDTIPRDAREACFTALGSIGSQSTVGALTPFLAGEDLEVARWAASALGRIGHRDAAPKLLDALRGDDPSVRDMAAWALQQISGKKLGNDAAAWQKWVYGEGVR